MERGQIVSITRRLDSASSITLPDILDEIERSSGIVPDEIWNALAASLRRGVSVATVPLAQAVVRSKSPALYAAARERVMEDLWALTVLLAGSVPDPAVEQALADNLHRESQAGGDVIRRAAALEALARGGSTACLDTLLAVEFDFSGRYLTAKSVVHAARTSSAETITAEQMSKLVEMTADADFGNALRSAIAAVRDANRRPQTDWAFSPEEVASAPGLGLFAKHRARAHESLQRHDLGAALNHARKALEALLKSVIKERGLPSKNGDPVDGMQLPQLIGIVQAGLGLPKDILKDLGTVQDDSTYGSHDQGKDIEERFTVPIVQSTIDRLDRICRYFEPLLSRRS